MPIWTMIPEGRRGRVVLAHRAHAAAMAEDAVLTEEQSERVTASLRVVDAKTGHTIHYGQGDTPLCGAEPKGAYWTNDPYTVAECPDCLELVS